MILPPRYKFDYRSNDRTNETAHYNNNTGKYHTTDHAEDFCPDIILPPAFDKMNCLITSHIYTPTFFSK
jgi:hypothetical protein